MDIFNKLAQIIEQGQSAVLCTVVKSSGSTPRKSGSKMLVCSNGKIEGSVGGGKIEFEVMEEALGLMHSNQTLLKEYGLSKDLGMQCGGKMMVFLEPVNPKARLLIFGAGHIGKVLSHMAKDFGFNVFLIDNRPEIAEKNPKVKLASFPDAWRSMEFLHSDFVVVTTYKHTYDEEIVGHVLTQPHAYIGMMASKRKAAVARKKWQESGVSEESIQKVFSPIGVQIDCETPEEIALSILAQVVDEYNKWKKQKDE